jgi:hypothetical protein
MIFLRVGAPINQELLSLIHPLSLHDFVLEGMAFGIGGVNKNHGRFN